MSAMQRTAYIASRIGIASPSAGRCWNSDQSPFPCGCPFTVITGPAAIASAMRAASASIQTPLRARLGRIVVTASRRMTRSGIPR